MELAVRIVKSMMMKKMIKLYKILVHFWLTIEKYKIEDEISINNKSKL